MDWSKWVVIVTFLHWTRISTVIKNYRFGGLIAASLAETWVNHVTKKSLGEKGEECVAPLALPSR